MVERHHRHFVEGAVIKEATARFGCPPTPLFKEEGDFGIRALIADVSNPLGFDGPRPMAALSPYYNPVDSCQIKIG